MRKSQAKEITGWLEQVITSPEGEQGLLENMRREITHVIEEAYEEIQNGSVDSDILDESPYLAGEIKKKAAELFPTNAKKREEFEASLAAGLEWVTVYQLGVFVDEVTGGRKKVNWKKTLNESLKIFVEMVSDKSSGNTAGKKSGNQN